MCEKPKLLVLCLVKMRCFNLLLFVKWDNRKKMFKFTLHLSLSGFQCFWHCSVTDDTEIKVNLCSVQKQNTLLTSGIFGEKLSVMWLGRKSVGYFVPTVHSNLSKPLFYNSVLSIAFSYSVGFTWVKAGSQMMCEENSCVLCFVFSCPVYRYQFIL